MQRQSFLSVIDSLLRPPCFEMTMSYKKQKIVLPPFGREVAGLRVSSCFPGAKIILLKCSPQVSTATEVKALDWRNTRHS